MKHLIPDLRAILKTDFPQLEFDISHSDSHGECLFIESSIMGDKVWRDGVAYCNRMKDFMNKNGLSFYKIDESGIVLEAAAKTVSTTGIPDKHGATYLLQTFVDKYINQVIATDPFNDHVEITIKTTDVASVQEILDKLDKAKALVLQQSVALAAARDMAASNRDDY